MFSLLRFVGYTNNVSRRIPYKVILRDSSPSFLNACEWKCEENLFASENLSEYAFVFVPVFCFLDLDWLSFFLFILISLFFLFYLFYFCLWRNLIHFLFIRFDLIFIFVLLYFMFASFYLYFFLFIFIYFIYFFFLCFMFFLKFIYFF